MVKIKLLAVLLTAFFAISALVAAEAFSVSPTSISFTQNSSSGEFTVTNSSATNAYSLIFIKPTITAESKTIDFSISGNPQDSKFTISTPFTDYTSLKFGKTYSGTLVINDTVSNESKSVSLNVQKSYCTYGEAGKNLTISEVSITNFDGDDTDWTPLDEIEVKVEVLNENGDEDDDIKTSVKMELYNQNGKALLKLDKIDLGKIDGGDDKVATFTFQVPADLGVDDSYFIYVKAYQDGKEKDICTSKIEGGYSMPVSVDRESDEDKYILIDEITLDESALSCGSETALSARVSNVGEEDQDKVKINLVNKELGISQYVILDNFDQGDDSKTIDFRFVIPKTAAAKTYKLELTPYYDYDEDYEEDDDGSYSLRGDTWKVDLKLESCGVTPSPTEDISIDAALDSDAKAGEEIKVKATIINEGDSSQSVTILASGMESFASLNRIEPSTFTLASGSSKDVLIYLDADDSAKGDYSFNIKAVYGGKMEEQPVSLTVEGKSAGFSISGLNKNWVIWLIIAVNIILLVLIIIVAVRLSR